MNVAEPSRPGEAGPGTVGLRPGVPGHPAGRSPDDEFAAQLLIRMWVLASGRTLRRGVRPEELSEDELIRFWADDLVPSTGRHAGADAGLAGAAR
jgi:hypothetical protein